MSFPKYGELAMNIKRPAGEFDDKSDIKIEHRKDYVDLIIGETKYQIFADPIVEADVDSMMEAGHQFGKDDITIKGVGLDWRSIKTSAGEIPDDTQKQRIIEILSN